MKYEITTLNTKKALASSLKKIMKKKPLSKITVSEIISDCKVNRKTFYYHFKDIYDLVKWILDFEAIEALKKFDLIVDYEEAILFVMDYVEQNELIISCAYDAMGREEMRRFFYPDFFEIISSLITSAEKMLETSLEPEYKKFLCRFYTEALTGILIDWVKHRIDHNREQYAKYIRDTIKFSNIGIMRANKR